MNRLVFGRTTCLAIAAGMLTFALSAGPVSGASPCAQRVLDDWLENERVDRVYPLPCYEGAIEAMPLDLRDYSSAVDVIARALASATRQGDASGEAPSSASSAAAGVTVAPTSDSRVSSLPIPLVVVGVLSLVLLAAGALGHVARRRRANTGDLPEP